jgi:hypothetical protein
MRRGAVIAVLSLGLEACGPACAETWLAAEDIEWPMGEHGNSFRDDPGTFIAVLGPLSDAAGGHVVYANILVLPPPGTEPAHTGGPAPGDCSKQVSTLTWKKDAEVRTFTYEYAGRNKELAIAGQLWSTKTANTFVVTLDKDWQPAIKPLGILIRSDTPDDVLTAIQRELPEDLRIARLRFGAPQARPSALQGGAPQNNAYLDSSVKEIVSP